MLRSATVRKPCQVRSMAMHRIKEEAALHPNPKIRRIAVEVILDMYYRGTIQEHRSLTRLLFSEDHLTIVRALGLALSDRDRRVSSVVEQAFDKDHTLPMIIAAILNMNTSSCYSQAKAILICTRALAEFALTHPIYPHSARYMQFADDHALNAGMFAYSHGHIDLLSLAGETLRIGSTFNVSAVLATFLDDMFDSRVSDLSEFGRTSIVPIRVACISQFFEILGQRPFAFLVGRKFSLSHGTVRYGSEIVETVLDGLNYIIDRGRQLYLPRELVEKASYAVQSLENSLYLSTFGRV
ncbi:MAG: hypothetical protein Q7S22_06725 [Candidatus Micrarchaeota archaeon]|nr:hypothetical protein [Candidatus Micrarchaeota archaeon]